MEQQPPQAPAVQLLQWLDSQDSQDVMSAIIGQLTGGAGLEAGLSMATAAAAPVTLSVDLSLLAHHDPALAMEVMANTDELEAQATALINNQLASMHPAPPDPAEDDLADEPPAVRVCLTMQQVPLPLSTVPDLVQQVVSHNNNSNSNTSNHNSHSSRAPRHLASLLAVVTGVSPPADTCHSQRFHCPSCNQDTDVRISQSSLPCCNIPKTEWLKEDITGRLMVQTQQLWVSALSSATGRCKYSVSGPGLPVSLPEHLVGSCSLGDVVHLIGHASIKPTPGPSSSCAVQVQANNLTVQHPQMLWALEAPATTSTSSTSSLHSESEQQPLQHMWDLLTTALGYNTPLDPHLAVAMLLSAAAVGSSNSGSNASAPAGLKQLSQVSLLVLHEAFSPATPRLLREAAALLTPQSVAMPVHGAEHVTPITGGGSTTATTDAASKAAVFASLLHLTNSGIAAADLSLMTNKSRTQLLQALQARQTPLPKDMPPGLLLPPLTATCWAAASWQDVCPSAGGEGGGHGVKRGRGGSGAGGNRTTWHGFDLCIGDGTVYEDDLWGALEIQASTAQEQLGLQQSQLEATGCLRQLLAGAAGTERPVLSEAAQAFLGQYFLMVRQSVDGSSHVSKPHLLSSVVAVASATARLHQRSTVLECPDAALAVVLMEQTLANKLGEAYHSLLDLPCDLNPSNDRTLDEQLQLLHEVISRAFRQSGLAGSYEDEDDAHMQEGGGAWGVGVGEDSGDSGCGGGVGGYGFAGGAGGGGDKDAGGNDVVPEE